MRDYLFVLGRDSKLAFLEVISYLGTLRASWELREHKKDVAIFRIEDLDYLKAISRLGGTIKIAEVISEGKFDDLDVYHGVKNKVNYTINVHGNAVYLKKFEAYVKTWFKKNKVRATKKKKKVSPKELKGSIIEFILFDKYVSRTVAVSNPSEYKKRDKERPVNEFVRSTSIRLAKMLINLTQARPKELLLDPFCGVGVILQEALLMGMNVVGVDIEEGIAKGALKNVKYTAKAYDSRSDFRVHDGDATKLNLIFGGRSVDCVASEPYLGPFLKKIPRKAEALKIIDNLNDLYLRFFKVLKKVLKKNGKVAIIIPSFKTDRGILDTDIDNILKKTGFEICNLSDKVKLPVVYNKGKDVIIRKIYVLQLI